MLDPLLKQHVPANVRYAVNYFEEVSSPLGGIWLGADEASTAIENRRNGDVSSAQARVGKERGGAAQDLERLLSIAFKMKADEQKAKQDECVKDRQSCVSR